LKLPIDIVYFSNYSGNTKKFVERLSENSYRIPMDCDGSNAPIYTREFVLVVPTYGGGSERTAIPRQVRHFLNVKENRALLRGVVGTGNTNFGEYFCKAAHLISAKAGVPLIARVEIFGTTEDINDVTERLQLNYG